MVKFLRALVCALLTVVAVVAAAPGASAAPPTSPYAGSAVGDVANVSLTLGPLAFAGARLANSEASTTNPPAAATSTSRNLAATVVGLGATVGVNQLVGPPSAGPTTGTLVAADALGISSGAITSVNEVNVEGVGNCATDGPAAQTTTTTAGLNVTPTNLLGVGEVLDTGDSSVTTTTGLVPTTGAGFDRAVESEAVGTLSDVSLFGGEVTIAVAGDATLNASADGTTGGADVTYDAPVVTVTFEGDEFVLDAAGESTDVELGALGRVTVTLNAPTGVVESADGLTASASVNVVTLEVELGPLAGVLGTSTIQLLPLSVSAVSPVGGIDCPVPAPVVTAPADGATIGDNTPTYRGTGVPGASIDLTVDGLVREDVATVDDDGNWSFTPTTPLADGPHTVSAVQAIDGIISVPSAVNAFVIDTDAPDAPVITDPEDGDVLTDDTPTISGTGEPGATVTVSVDGEEVGEATVDSGGNWELPLTEPLDDGEHTVSATQTDEAGNESPADEVTFVVDTEAAPPVITNPADGSSIADTTPTIEGTAEPGADVEVSVDGEVVGTVTADDDGNWELPLTEPLAEGEHIVSAVQTDAVGNVSEPADNEFTVDVTAPAAPVITSPEDGETIDDRTPTIVGTGEPGVTIVVIVDGEPVGAVVVDRDGNWSFTLPTPLANGDHTIEAVAVDAAGNESGADSIEITVDVPGSPDGGSGSGPILADTGGPSLGYLVVGGVLLLVGGTVLSLTRRQA